MFFWNMSWPDDCAMCLSVCLLHVCYSWLKNHRPGSPTPEPTANHLKCLSMCNGKSRTYSTKKTWITFLRYSSLDVLKWDRRGGVELCTFLALIMVFAMMQHSALSVAACAQIVQCLGGQANLASGAIPHSKPVTLLSSRL